MAIDRSKFKRTSVAQMQQADQEVATAMNRKGSRPGMLSIDEGKNKFRIYPAHPEDGLEDIPFAQPSVKTFLPMMVDEKDKEGNLTGAKKESSRPVFNSRIHGSAEKDLVEEYIKLCRQYADTNWDPKSKDPKEKAARQAYLDKVYGKYSDNPSQRLMGINYKTAYVMYADKIIGDKREFGRLEVKESVKSKMNILANQEAQDEPMGLDPYTDLETGRCVVVFFDKNAKKSSDYYTTSLDATIDPKTRKIIDYPIDDEMLERFDKYPTLRSLYENVFTRKDFLLQVEGLEFFDKKYNMGIFETEEFQEVLGELSELYPEEEEGEEVDDVVEEIENEREESAELKDDAYSLMSRTELRKHIAKKKLPIVVMTKMTDDQIREMIRDAENEEAIEQEIEEVEEIEEVKERPATRAADRLAVLRRKTNK